MLSKRALPCFSFKDTRNLCLRQQSWLRPIEPGYLGWLLDLDRFGQRGGAFSLEDTSDKFHEDAGAAVLEGVFPAIVVEAVKHHVAAKRYLCAVNRDYHDALSPASVHSLMLQGGPMSADERAAFETNPHLEQILLVRSCDDRGKVPGLAVPPLDHYLPMMRRVLQG